jgi:hypothetical protein
VPKIFNHKGHGDLQGICHTLCSSVSPVVEFDLATGKSVRALINRPDRPD